MQDVAQEAELSQPFLSQIERGLATPSMRSLDRLAQALGTTGLALLAGDPTQGTVDVIRANDRTRGLQRALVPKTGSTALTAGERPLRAVELNGGWREFRRYAVHHNDEFVIVQSGRYESDVAGEIHVLGPGDAITYPGGVPHRLRCIGDGAHRLLSVTVNDEFDVVPRAPGTPSPRTAMARSASAVVANTSCGDLTQ